MNYNSSLFFHMDAHFVHKFLPVHTPRYRIVNQFLLAYCRILELVYHQQ